MMVKENQHTIEEKLVKLKEIFDSDVVVTLGVQKKSGKVELLNCERSIRFSDGQARQMPKHLLEEFPPSYMG